MAGVEDWSSDFGMSVNAFEEAEKNLKSKTPSERESNRTRRRGRVYVSWDVVQDLTTHSLLHFLLTAEGKWYLSATPPKGFKDWEAAAFLPPTPPKCCAHITNADLAFFAKHTPDLNVVYDENNRAVGVQHKFLVPSPNWQRLKRLCPSSL